MKVVAQPARERTWTDDGAGLLRSPLLASAGVVAGFTTRALGSMAGRIYPPEAQEANRRALAERLGFAELARVKQVHGARVIGVERQPDPWPEADGMWTRRTGLLLGVAAADCVPLLVSATGIVGAAHAGWQGTTLRAAHVLVRALAAEGARVEDMVAAVGPSIGPCCYTIDDARAAVIRDRLGADAADCLLAADDIRFDLWSANATQLAAAGVRRVEVAGICTRCGGADVWSYRGEAGQNGSGLGVIGMPA